MHRLILFVHGLGGDGEGTWGAFKRLIGEDPALAGWDIAFHRFPTSVVRINPFAKISSAIERLAANLDTEIRTLHADYDEIMVVAHSMGGVVARKYFVEQVKAGAATPVRMLLLFATPNEGADIAKWGTLVSVKHQHLSQLRRQSEFLNALNRDWMRLQCGQKVRAIHVTGLQDRIVPFLSSRATWAGAAEETIADADHGSIVKPASAEAVSFRLVRREALALGAADTVAVANPTLAGPAAPQPAGGGAAPNPLFNVYTPADEPFYVSRGEDGQLSPAVRYSHIWLVGPIGCGKTACATRALERSVGRFRSVSLAIAVGGGASALLEALHLRLARITGAPQVPAGDLVDAVADRLGEAAAQGIQALLIEELPLETTDASASFFASVSAIVMRQAAEAAGVPVRLVFASATDPGAAFSGNSHAAEVMTVVRIGTWSDVDLRRLVATILSELRLELSDPELADLLSSCQASPRFVKMFFSTMLTLPASPDRFAIALATTAENMSS